MEENVLDQSNNGSLATILKYNNDIEKNKKRYDKVNLVVDGKKYQVLAYKNEPIVVNYHNAGQEGINTFFRSKKVVSYNKLIQILLPLFFIKIGNVYYLNPSMLEIKLSDNYIKECLKRKGVEMPESTLQYALNIFEQKGFLIRYTTQNKMTGKDAYGKTRIMSFNLKKLLKMNFGDNDEFMDPKTVKDNKSLSIQIRKYLLTRLFSITLARYKRKENFQEFIKYQQDVLKLPVKNNKHNLIKAPPNLICDENGVIIDYNNCKSLNEVNKEERNKQIQSFMNSIKR